MREDFSAGPEIKTLVSNAGVGVQSLVRELRFPHAAGHLSPYTRTREKPSKKPKERKKKVHTKK